MISPALTAAVGPPKAFIQNIAKSERWLMSDVKSRAPAFVKKAVLKRYPNQAAADKALVPKWRSTIVKKNFLQFAPELQGMTMTFAAARHAAKIAGLPAPFSPLGPYGHRKTHRANAKGGKYAKGWVHGELPWEIETPLGRAKFGRDKGRLFALPSPKQALPLLFRRDKDGPGGMKIIKTTSVPQEVTATSPQWRKKIGEMTAKRLEHHLKRLGVAIKDQ